MWGPAEAEGLVDERGVVYYTVYFADECGNVLGDGPVVVVQRREYPAISECCLKAYYQTIIEAQTLPEGATQFLVFVAGQYGQASIGAGTAIEDNDVDGVKGIIEGGEGTGSSQRTSAPYRGWRPAAAVVAVAAAVEMIYAL
jgi:hypothetical protein